MPQTLVAETPWRTAMLSTMSDVVLDANVLVGFLDPSDVHHGNARELTRRIQEAARNAVLLDFLMEEALAVILRRAKERKQGSLSVVTVCSQIRAWYESGLIESTLRDLDGRLPSVLDVVAESNGKLNPNDAKLVLLQRDGVIGALATFDAALAAFPGMLVFG